MRGGGRGKPRGQRGHLEPGQVLVQLVSASLRPPSRASVRAVAGKSPKPSSLTMVNRRERGEREVVYPASDKAHHRHSIINISAQKKASKVKFYINSDKFFKGEVIAVNN